MLHGVEALQQAAEESDDAWLTLRWNHAMRRLVQESYGSRMDISFYYYDGRCPECERRFVIGAEDVVLDEAEAQLEAEALEEEGHTSEMPEPTMLRVALTEA